MCLLETIFRFLWESQCPPKVSEPKWASVQATLREGIYWYSGGHVSRVRTARA